MPSAVALPAYSAPDADLSPSPAAGQVTPADEVNLEQERRRAERIAAAAAQWQGMGAHGSAGVVFAPRSIPPPKNSIFVVAKLAKIHSEPALLDAYKSLLKFPATVAVGSNSSLSPSARRVRTLKSSVRAVNLAVDEWDSLAGRSCHSLALRVRTNRQSQEEDDSMIPASELLGGDAFDTTPSSSSASTVRSLASILPNSPHSSIQDALNNLDDLTTNDLLPETHPADDQQDSAQDQDESLDADPSRLPPPPPRYECATGVCSRQSLVAAAAAPDAPKSKRRPSFQALLPGMQPGMAHAHAGDEYQLGHARLTTVVADYKSPRLAHLQHHVHFAFPGHDDAAASLAVAHVPGLVEHVLQVIALDLANKYKVQAAGSASGFVFSSTRHEVGDKFVVSVPKDDVATRLAIKALDVFESCPGMEDDSDVASYVVDLSEFVKFISRR